MAQLDCRSVLGCLDYLYELTVSLTILGKPFVKNCCYSDLWGLGRFL